MANRPKGYGFSKEVQDRVRAKYSEEDEVEVVAWISTITGDSPREPGFDVSTFSMNFGTISCTISGNLVTSL